MASAPTPASLATPVLTEQIGDNRIEVLGKDARLKVGSNSIRIEVRDVSGRPVDVGQVSLRMHMDMPGMPMQADAVLQKSDKPGVYTGTINPGMGGDWTAHIMYDGPKGRDGKTTTITVNP